MILNFKGLSRFVGFLAILGFSTLVSAQVQESNSLVDEVNERWQRAGAFSRDAGEKQAAADRAYGAGTREKGHQLIEEAAKLMLDASEQLDLAAAKSEEIVRLQDPEWYRTYFQLRSKLAQNMAHLARAAHDELLVRKKGAPTSAQLARWKKDIARLGKENAGLRTKIAEIEAEHPVELSK